MNAKFPALRLLSVLSLCAAFTPGLHAAGSSHGPEVLVASDAISAPDGFRPSPGKPIFYILAEGQKSLGDSIAGIKIPQPAIIERAIVAELAKQGYIRTQVGGPVPSIFILALFGDSNFSPATDDDVAAMQGFTLHGTADEAAQMAYQLSARFRDKPAVESIVGIGKVQSIDTPNGLKVAHAANEERFYLSLCAFEAATFKKEKRLLWRTSMSIDWRNDFALALPAMLASGGPSFGRDLKEPTFLDDRDRRNFDVEIGEAKVVPEETKSGSRVNSK